MKGMKMKSGKKAFKRVLKEFAGGKLHSGSKTGPKVKKTSQARAIAYSEDRAANKKAKKAEAKYLSKCKTCKR